MAQLLAIFEALSLMLNMVQFVSAFIVGCLIWVGPALSQQTDYNLLMQQLGSSSSTLGSSMSASAAAALASVAAHSGRVNFGFPPGMPAEVSEANGLTTADGPGLYQWRRGWGGRQMVYFNYVYMPRHLASERFVAYDLMYLRGLTHAQASRLLADLLLVTVVHEVHHAEQDEGNPRNINQSEIDAYDAGLGVLDDKLANDWHYGIPPVTNEPMRSALQGFREQYAQRQNSYR